MPARSTLAALQAPPAAAPVSISGAPEDLPGDVTKTREGSVRKRVAVDGPDAFGADLAATALRLAALCPGPAIEAAIAARVPDPEPTIRLAAAEALARRAESLRLGAEARGPRRGARRSFPTGARAGRLVVGPRTEAAPALVPCLSAPDLGLRDVAIAALAPASQDIAIDALADQMAPARRAGLSALVAAGQADLADRAIEATLRAGDGDMLAVLACAFLPACIAMRARLDTGRASGRETILPIEGLTGAHPGPPD